MKSADSRSLSLHLVYWVCYLVFKIYHEYIWLYPSYPELSGWSVFYSAVMAQALMLIPKVLMAYWMYLFWIPLVANPFVKSFALVLGFLVTLMQHRFFVVLVVQPVAYKENPENQDIFSLERLSSATIDIALAVGIFIALILYDRYRDAEKRQYDLEKEKVTTELKLLKSQTNPHFLFNTLNSIYVLVRKNANEASEAILQLSNLMRFVLYETTVSRIGLDKEIAMIKDYIALEKLRFGDRLCLDENLPQIAGLKIAPMLLVSIVENAFKHSAEIEGKVAIRINIEVEDNRLRLYVENTSNEESHNEGLGLSNLRRQLELEYPGHQLILESNGTRFAAKLELELLNEEN